MSSARSRPTDGGLLTCAIRPGGIYGPGEAMIFPRVVAECARGRFVAIIGDGSAMSDNTYIENLIDGHLEAARHLVPGSPLGGQAYFVTDGAPVNYFEFFRPFVERSAPGSRRLSSRPLRSGCVLGLGAAPLAAARRARAAPARARAAQDRGPALQQHREARRDFGWTPR